MFLVRILCIIGIVASHYSFAKESASFLTDWEVRTVSNAQGSSDDPFRPLQAKDLALPREFVGHIDYKARFKLDHSTTKPLGIFLGQIGDVDRVYINGQLIGQTGGFPPNYEPYLDLYREYLIPSQILRIDGFNEVRIETYVEYVGQKGLNPPSVEIGDHQQLQKKKYYEETLWYIFKLGMPILCLFICIVSMPWMAAKNQIRPNVLLFLTGLGYCIFGFGKSRMIFHFVSPVPAYKILTTSALFGLVAIFVYSLDLCRIRRKWPYVFAVGIPAIFALRIYSGTTLQDTSAYVKDWLLGSIPLLFIISWVTLFLAKGHSIWVRIGVLCLAIVAANDALNAVRVINFVNLMDFGFCGFILSMLISQMISMKRNWVALSKKEADLMWSTRFLKMASQVGHDIRSPLSSMLPALDEIGTVVQSGDFPNKQKVTNSIDIIHSGLQRMTSLSSRVLDEYKNLFENADTKPKYDLRQTLVDKLILDVVNEARAVAPSHVSFKVNGFSNIPEIWGVVEVGEFQSAIANILRNSAESMEKTPPEIAAVVISIEATKDKAVLKITDRGVGIPQEVIDKVFLEGFSFGKEKGTGLGLSQAKTAILKCDGTLELESKQGEGTSVKITLPREPEPKLIKKTIQLSAKRPIYFVDDDPSILSFWRDRIRSVEKAQLKVGYYRTFDDVPKDNLTDAILISDYYFRSEVHTGLDRIKKLSPMPEVYLCTSDYDDIKIQEEAKKIGIFLIPKPILQGFTFSI